MRSRRIAQLQILLAAIFFSTAGLFMGFLSTDIWSIIFWRSTFAFVFIGALIGFNLSRHLVSPDLAGLFAALASSGAMLAFVAALRLTSVANVAVIYGALPLVAALIGWLVLRDPITRATGRLCVLAGSGAIVIFLGSASSGSRLAGDALALLMTILMALMTIALRRSKTSSLAIVAVSNALAALTATCCSPSLAVSLEEAVILACFALVQMTMGLLFYTMGSRHLLSAETALITLAEVPLSSLWVWAAFGRPIAPLTLVGAGIILTAVTVNLTAQPDRCDNKGAKLDVDRRA